MVVVGKAVVVVVGTAVVVVVTVVVVVGVVVVVVVVIGTVVVGAAVSVVGVTAGSDVAGSEVAGSDDAVGSDVAGRLGRGARTSWVRSVPASRWSFPPIVITVAPLTMRMWFSTHCASAAVAEETRSPSAAASWSWPCAGDELDLDVVAVAAVEDVVAAAAEQHVVAGAAEQHVVAGAADEDVVAVAAVGGELDAAGRQARGLDHVVAGQRVDRQPVVGGLGAGDVDLGGQAEDGRAGSRRRSPGRRRRRWCR